MLVVGCSPTYALRGTETTESRTSSTVPISCSPTYALRGTETESQLRRGWRQTRCSPTYALRGTETSSYFALSPPGAVAALPMPFGALKHVNPEQNKLCITVAALPMPFGALKLRSPRAATRHIDGCSPTYALRGTETAVLLKIQVQRQVAALPMPFGALMAISGE